VGQQKLNPDLEKDWDFLFLQEFTLKFSVHPNLPGNAPSVSYFEVVGVLFKN